MEDPIKAGAPEPTVEVQVSKSGEEQHAPPVLRYGFRMFGKPPPFSRRQWRVFGIAATAGFFDNYDRALLSLALKQIQRGLGIAEARLGAMLSTIRLGYLLSLMITPFADVFGRRRLLLSTIIGYTIFTGLSALAPSQAYFVTFQILARAFAVAEATVALVILTEEVEAGVRGWAVGYLGALTAVGYGLAAGVFAFVNVIPFGWRGLFAIALVPLVLIIPLRRALPESRRFERVPQQFKATDIRTVREVARKRPSEIFAAITRWMEMGVVKRKERGLYEGVQPRKPKKQLNVLAG